MIETHDWILAGPNPEKTRINTTTGQLEEQITYYRGPTPIQGENGQLELLLRTLKDQRRKERLAKLALKQED